MASDLLLYSYWRSSAAYRVRIALNLKGLPYAMQPVHLVREGGEQHAPGYAALNPLEVVPTLRVGEQVLTQSLAIIEYLEDTHPQPPLLPPDALGRARVRALAQIVASDIHPIGNLRVLQQLGRQFGADDAQKAVWMRHWVSTGLAAFERLLADSAATGRFCHGDTPGLADRCLIPQLYNARRFELPLEAYPNLLRVEAACQLLSAFTEAAPERMPDAPAAAG